jgi:hypothetical protein
VPCGPATPAGPAGPASPFLQAEKPTATISKKKKNFMFLLLIENKMMSF